jgi:hypothetical protein
MSAAIETEGKQDWEITDGPGALQLFVSLSEPNDSPRKRIDFHTSKHSLNVVCITLLAQADSTGEEFHLEGWMHLIKRGNIHGRYNARTRKGWFKRGHKYSLAAGLKQES